MTAPIRPLSDSPTASASAAPTPASDPAGAQVHLRLLETTDVHGHLMPFDYAADAEVDSYGLARTATLIGDARAEVANSLLLDNGDFLQGTPLSDFTAMPDHGWTGPHPVIATMNQLGYDAAALGNHEFNFGLDTLQAALADAAFPVLCANAVTRLGTRAEDDTALFTRTTILTRTCTDSAGQSHNLRIGLIGLVPTQITTWDKYHLQDRVKARDMVETARALVPRLRAEGADLVICMAHTGIDTGPVRPDMENAALALAQVPGIDALLCGHSHEVFPRPDAPAPTGDGVDHVNGTLRGVPAVMAGFRGSHLGVLDLWLDHNGTDWHITRHHAQARATAQPSGTPAHAAPAVLDALQGAHAATQRIMQAPLGHTDAPIHSYLSQIVADSSVRLVTQAQRAALADLLANGPLAGLPVLSASAPFKAGGRGGPDHYTDVAAGPLTLRSAADLYPFPNTLCALLLTGSQVRDWLERAASCFFQLTPDTPDQPLWNPAFPGHAFDTIDGLTCQIDLTRPAQYDASGTRIANGPGRIRSLRHDGQPVAPDARFVMAANNYRAFGGGPYPSLPPDAFALVSKTQVRDLLSRHMASGTGLPTTPPAWSLRAVPGATAIFDTGPGLRAHPALMQALDLQDAGLTQDGFLRLRIDLSTPLAHPL